MCMPVSALQPIRPTIAISSRRESQPAVAAPIGATGMAIIRARISSASRVSPRIRSNMESRNG